jgi:hypothetical protein
MKTLGFSRYAFTIGVGSALLAGCGGAQPPIGAPGAMPQRRADAQHADRIGSCMLPEAKSEDLLYVASLTESSAYVVDVFSYPGGKPTGQLNVEAWQLCSDTKGNIFITQGSRTGDDSKILEYAHGGTEPIAILSDPYNGATGCSVDPATGNLAVANTGGFNGIGTVLVYPQASGTPTVYQLSFQAAYCGYDGEGNLFVMGSKPHRAQESHPLAELAQGSGQFTRIKLKKHIEYPMGVQWDGTYLVLGDGTNNINSGHLRRYDIEGTHGILEGGVRLGVTANNFFVQASTVIVADGINDVWLIGYPGGTREKSIRVYTPYGVTVSVAQPRLARAAIADGH